MPRVDKTSEVHSAISAELDIGFILLILLPDAEGQGDLLETECQLLLFQILKKILMNHIEPESQTIYFPKPIIKAFYPEGP